MNEQQVLLLLLILSGAISLGFIAEKYRRRNKILAEKVQWQTSACEMVLGDLERMIKETNSLRDKVTQLEKQLADSGATSTLQRQTSVVIRSDVVDEEKVNG